MRLRGVGNSDTHYPIATGDEHERERDVAQFVVFDDDVTFLQMFKKSLLKHGVQSRGFGTVEEFLSLGEGLPDLFLVDLSMADPKGVHWEFGGILNIDKLRQAVGPDVPIWVLTGYEDGRIENECMRKGADKVILKREGVYETASDVSIHWNRRITGDRRIYS